MPDAYTWDMESCAFPGCVNKQVKRLYCSPHYKQSRKPGGELRPLRKYVSGPVSDRLAVWSAPDEYGCLVWNGHTYSNGYGRIRVDGIVRLVHRVAYEEAVGPIPEGLEIDHLCRNKLCILPAHLEPVTRRVNLLRLGKVINRGPDGRYVSK